MQTALLQDVKFLKLILSNKSLWFKQTFHSVQCRFNVVKVRIIPEIMRKSMLRCDFIRLLKNVLSGKSSRLPLINYQTFFF